MQTVLIIEDDAALGEALRTLLRQHRYGVVLVRSAEDARGALSQGLRPCAVLLELALPAPGVREAWRLLRREWPAEALPLPIIGLCGLRSLASDEVARPRQRGLRPPFEMDHLLTLLAQRCRGRAQEAS